MIIEGVDINARNTKEYTPLMIAAADGNIDTLKPLLNAGADINAQGRSDWTALTATAFGQGSSYNCERPVWQNSAHVS